MFFAIDHDPMATAPIAFQDDRHASAAACDLGSRPYNATLVQEAKDINRLLADACRQQRAGQLAAAEDLCSSAVACAPQRVDVWCVSGGVHRSLGRVDAAASAFRRALDIDPDNSNTRNLLAVSLMELGRFDEGIAEFQRAIALKPGDAELRYNLGVAFKQRGRGADAVAAWRIALELNPQHAGARRGLEEAGILKADRPRQPTPRPAAAPRKIAWPSSMGQLLDVAWQAHLAKDLATAEAGYRRALDIDAGQPDVWYLLGAVQHASDRAPAAIDCFQRAIKLKPDYADAHNYLAVTLVSLKRTDDAVVHFRRATELRPGDAELHVNLGVALRRQRQPADALDAFRAAVQLRPEHAKAHSHLRRCLRALRQYDELIESYRFFAQRDPKSPAALHGLGLALMEAKRFDEAVETLRRALTFDPGSARIRNNIGLALAGGEKYVDAVAVYREALRLKPDFAEVHNNLGVALGKQEKLDDAIAHYREAIRILPRFAAAHANLGGLLGNRGQSAAAEAHQRRAIELRPNFPEAHCNLGAVLMQEGRLDEAEAALRRALELKPDFIEAHANLGGAMATRGDLEAAEACYLEALQIDPKFPGARYNRSLVCLSQGRLEEGWEGYEFRFKCGEFKGKRYKEPRWDGAPLEGRTLLVHAEQGLGDSIQFVRYLPLIEDRGGRVIFLCPPPLEAMFRTLRSSVELVADAKRLPKIDVQIPLMSLPYLLGTRLETIPADVPYLAADPARMAAWADEFAGVRDFKVGICWQGNPKHKGDRYRSLPLTTFEPLVNLPGVRFFSLQKNHGQEQLAKAPFADQITNLAPRLDSFLDTAAAMQHLDLIVCCDTSLAHLAGALGRPVWVALPRSPDWRWLLAREDSPWYPSLRLFRQRRAGQWGEVFERITAALRELRDSRA